MIDLQPEEKLAIVKRVCKGFGQDLAVRLDPSDGRWRLSTPAVPTNDDDEILPPIEGVGAEPAAAIEDCWSQLIARPFMLQKRGMAVRVFTWDGVRFLEA